METNSSIFRPAAVQHYLNKRERTVFPIYTTPPTALCAALLFAILAVGVLLAALIRVPVYAQGVAVPIAAEGTVNSSGTVEVAIFMPEEVLSRLGVGQKVFLRDDSMGWRVGGRIRAFGSDASSSPDNLIRVRLPALPDEALPDEVSKDPAAVALVGPRPSALAKGNGRKDVFEVSVEIGDRRLLSSGR